MKLLLQPEKIGATRFHVALAHRPAGQFGRRQALEILWRGSLTQRFQRLVDGLRGGSERRVAKAFVVVEYDIPRRCAAGYFPEMNVLVPIDSVAAGSNQPASKSMVVTVERSGFTAWARIER